MTPKIEKLIVKYITKSATGNDLDTLSEWIKKPSNKQVFKDYVQTHYAITYSMNNPDSQKALENLLLTIRKEKSWVYKLKTQPVFKYAVAAILVMALATTYFLRENIFDSHKENTPPIIVNNQIKPGIDKATLTLENGEVVALEKGTTYQTQNATSNGEEIVYNIKENSTSRELVFNYLTVPRGGQFYIKLSDGTEVWLNSESQLKYPVSFTDGQSRQVELVYGEAYFEVSHSTEHQGSDFKVLNNNQIIKVLGTKFNIKAYRDESEIYTTLVEGRVSVTTSNTNQILAPGEQSILDLVDHSLKVQTVDVSPIISWKDGVFSFEHEPLKNIMRVLSRWYDMNVTFDDAELKDKRFNGLINKSYNIESILSMLKSSNSINTYEINNKTITLK